MASRNWEPPNQRESAETARLDECPPVRWLAEKSLVDEGWSEGGCEVYGNVEFHVLLRYLFFLEGEFKIIAMKNAT